MLTQINVLHDAPTEKQQQNLNRDEVVKRTDLTGRSQQDVHQLCSTPAMTGVDDIEFKKAYAKE